MKQDNFALVLKAIWKNAFAIACALVMLAAPVALQAQTATIYGSVSNFDVVNDTEHESHGFEIEMEGIQSSDVYSTFTAQRYGAPVVSQTGAGIKIRWESQYANGAFTKTTIAHAANTPFAGSCYQWGANYDQSGCEHFGVSVYARPTRTVYRWLIEDPATPGALLAVNPPVAIPAPVYTINPPAQEGEAPELVAEIEAPEPAEAPEVYGDAQWVKVFKTELQREVTLDELVSDNPIVPRDAAHAEVSWEIIQAEPASNSNSNGNRRQKRNQGSLSAGTRAVIRRYEIYRFTGAYDPVTHEALCADLACNAPAEGEVGEYVGAQMAAANVSVPAITVNKNGNGTVESADRLIRCGLICTEYVNPGAIVTLTAIPARDNVFTGWTGACAGNQLTCTVTLNDSQTVTANFAQTFSINVKTSGKGSVSGTAGIDCGKTCSTRVAQGSSVTLTARPETGFRFQNWSGACSGTALTCTVPVNGNLQAQANFVKN